MICGSMGLKWAKTADEFWSKGTPRLIDSHFLGKVENPIMNPLGKVIIIMALQCVTSHFDYVMSL